jgi:hypothetical protein
VGLAPVTVAVHVVPVQETETLEEALVIATAVEPLLGALLPSPGYDAEIVTLAATTLPVIVT